MKIKINEQYINALTLIYDRYKKEFSDLTEMENELNSLQETTNNWIKDNLPLLETLKTKSDLTENDGIFAESKLLEFEKLVEIQSKKTLAKIKSFNDVKKEIDKIYEKIIKAYPDHTEDEIIESIKEQIKDR